MKLIAAVSKDWAIGNKGELLISIPEDMKFFRTSTTGNVVIMGRKTLFSFPNQKPLKNRENIVITRDENFSCPGAIVVNSVEEAVKKAEEFSDKEIYVIGGASIYEQMLKYCDTAYITYIDYSYAADAYFPNLDKDPEWELTNEDEEHTYFDVSYFYRVYKRVK